MTTAPNQVEAPRGEDAGIEDRVWNVIVWNDPVNLMSYVVWVFQSLFGFTREKATQLMLVVHNEGRAVVHSGPREQAEMDAFRLHHHGLWATLERG
jgi:ATP-dependent Clp protease adaptor protein ClpS